MSGSHVILDVFANARSQSCVRIANRSNVSHAKSSGLIVPESQVDVGVEVRIQRILCDGLPKKQFHLKTKCHETTDCPQNR
jgi:hypothetical protein